MNHPHAYLLEEYRIAIDKLVPLAPDSLREEAQKLYADLLAENNVTERQIKQALIYIGKKEYPYRKAYQALCATDEEKRLEAAALKKIEPAILEKIEPVLQHGVHLTDYANSKLFEKELTAPERYRVEQAILEAHDVINKQCDERARARQKSYEELVEKARLEQAKIQNLIDQLRQMADRDPKWSLEITGKADQFEEGWSVVERDPLYEEVVSEIENWSTILEETSDVDEL